MNSQRRDFMRVAGGALVTTAIATAPLMLATQAASQTTTAATPSANPTPLGELTKHELPKLPYAYDALEPHIDAKTMELHHSKHHKAYVDNLIKSELELAKARGAGDFSLVQHWSRQLSFNYGGHALHSLFWNVMAPASSGGGGEPQGILADKIKRDFGSFDLFRKQFSEAAAKVEGAGWALLHHRPTDDRLIIGQAENQQKMAHWGASVLMGLDVWEHAYYLKYQNRRADYIEAWWNIVNWKAVSDNLAKSAKS